ncbi:MAG: hypothetical protein R3B48_07905 [Kofleriaceae bacterium]
MLPTSPPGPDGAPANEELAATPPGKRDTALAKARPTEEPNGSIDD